MKKIDKDKVIQLHLEGRLGVEIADAVGCCQAAVGKILRDAGYSQKIGVDKGKVFALARAGWKVRDIAGDVGITEVEVRKILSEKRGGAG